MILNITVNNNPIKARKGETLLSALNRNGIDVPTLCHLPELTPSGSCRMCVVEAEGYNHLLTACSYPVEEGMRILTHSPRVLSARKTLIELLLASHPDDCLYCVRSGDCELQRLATSLNIVERNYLSERPVSHLDRSSAGLVYDPVKCILCGRCVRTCEEIVGANSLDFIKRGESTAISTSFSKSISQSNCILCGQCLLVCPTAALREKDNIDQVMIALHDPKRFAVVQYDPTITITLAEEFGIRTGKDIQGILNAALRKIGFRKVFLTSMAGDIYTHETVESFARNIESNQSKPLILSNCPAWIKFAEQSFPDILPFISPLKSPQQMLGALIKQVYAPSIDQNAGNVYCVSVAPCPSRKFESDREGNARHSSREVDAVLTARELARLIRLNGISMAELEPEAADIPFGTRSSAAKLYGTPGGTAEAILRTLHIRLTGDEMSAFKLSKLRGLKPNKEVKITIGDHEICVAAIHGLHPARQLIQDILGGRNKLHLIEIMACPGGCINGGGQPYPKTSDTLATRLKTIYEIDDKEPIRAAHKNPALVSIYDNFLGEAGGELSKKLFETNYTTRKVLL